MLVWPIAAKEPSAIEASAMKTIDLLPLPSAPGKAVVTTRAATATAAIFGAEAKKAVTGVGAPS